MPSRKLLVIIAAIFTGSSARIEYEKNGEDWVRQRPFQIIMSWYLTDAYAATVQVIHNSEGDTVYRQSSRFISLMQERIEISSSVVVTHHVIEANSEQKLYTQDGRTFDGNESFPCETSAMQSSRKDLSRRGYPRPLFHWEWQSLLTYGNCITVLLVSDEATFQAFLNNGGFWRRNKVKSMLIILVPESLDILCQGGPEKKEWKDSVKSILERVWTEDKVLNIFLSAPTSSCIKDYLFSWDPFTPDTNSVFGTLKRLKINADNPNVFKALSEYAISMKNMNGYPLKVTIFERSPTVLAKSGVDPNYESDNTMELDVDEMAGMDGLVLKTLYSWMNCSLELYPPSDDKYYGYQLKNGTFVGVVGDVVYRRVDFAANGVFLKDYQTDTATEFTIPTTCENICIVVPRAGMIPKWLQFFQCFSPLVWNLLFLNVLLCGLLRYVLRALLREEHSRRNLLEIVIEMALIFMGSPQNLPKLHSERILAGFYLLFGVIIVGSFQGTLYESFTSPDYYKNIDTLDELDASGLPIGTTSPNLQNIFGEDNDSTTLTNLRRRMRISETDSKIGSIARAAFNQDIAAIERMHDLKLIMNTKYLNDHGEAVLHIVEECPRTYHLSFMVPSGAFFLPRVNALLRRMVESGLVSYWYESTVNLLIVKSRYAMAKKLKPRNKNLPFNLENLQISFIVLTSGLLLSVLVFIGEVVIFRRKTPPGQTIPLPRTTIVSQELFLPPF